MTKMTNMTKRKHKISIKYMEKYIKDKKDNVTCYALTPLIQPKRKH